MSSRTESVSSPLPTSTDGVARRIVVQKFGGSSVAREEGRLMLVAKVKQALAEGVAPAVVVSAMGRRGDPYATDTLLGLLDFVNRDDREPREVDVLMACGEIISVIVCAHVLRQHGVPAVAMVGADTGVHTDGAHGEALITHVEPSALFECIRQGRVPVVAGFQGVAPDGNLTTLGRGGSDTTAVAVGVGLRAERVEIYSDVEGVMTVDPRVYAGAQLISALSYEELGELAVEGAKVMHPRSVDLAQAKGMPLRIRSTFTAHPGTTVAPLSDLAPLERQRIVTSITPLPSVAHVAVELPKSDGKDEALARIFEQLTGMGVSLDLINICPDALYFIVKEDFVEKVARVLEPWPNSILRDCAKISLVGVGMRGTPGVVGRIHRTLKDAGIEVVHSTDSNITVSCLVRGTDMAGAVQALHGEFLPRDTNDRRAQGQAR